MKKLVIALLVLAALGFGGYYYWTTQKTKTQPETPVTEEPQILTYENTNYGFSVELPLTWEGYTVKERASEDAELPTFDFELQNESIFAVSVYTKEEFSTITEEENPIVYGTKRAENTLYVFTAIGSQDVSDALYQRRVEVEEILKTFKAK